MSLRTRPRLVIGPWRAGADLQQGGLPPTPAPYPPPPQSRAPGKVSASARDSPWPLPSPRAPELRPPGRLFSEDPTPLTPGSAAAPAWGRPCARRRADGLHPSLRGNLSPGTLGNPRLSHTSGPGGPLWMGAAGGDWVPGGFDGDLGFPGLPSLPLACPGLGSPVCAASSRAPP